MRLSLRLRLWTTGVAAVGVSALALAVLLKTSTFTTSWCPNITVGAGSFVVALLLVDRVQAAAAARRRRLATAALIEIGFALQPLVAHFSNVAHASEPHAIADYLLRTPWDQPLDDRPGSSTLGQLLHDRFLDARALWRGDRALLAENPSEPLLEEAEQLFDPHGGFGGLISSWTATGRLATPFHPQVEAALRYEFETTAARITAISRLV